MKNKSLLKEFTELAKDPEKLREAIRKAEESMPLCPLCQSENHPSEAYCRGCGRRQDMFSEEEFQNFWGSTLEDLQEEECQKGHPIFTKNSSSEFPYCILCGSSLQTT